MNAYQELRDKHQKEFGTFPCFFAFDQKQFDEGMKKLGLRPRDTNKIYHGTAGMYYRKTDSPKLKEMIERFDREHWDAIAGDQTGEGYILDMFRTELANHEFGYTYELGETLEELSLTRSQVKADPKLLHGLRLALEKYGVRFEEADHGN